jgi:hypothetical protein
MWFTIRVGTIIATTRSITGKVIIGGVLRCRPIGPFDHVRLRTV